MHCLCGKTKWADQLWSNCVFAFHICNKQVFIMWLKPKQQVSQTSLSFIKLKNMAVKYIWCCYYIYDKCIGKL